MTDSKIEPTVVLGLVTAVNDDSIICEEYPIEICPSRKAYTSQNLIENVVAFRSELEKLGCKVIAGDMTRKCVKASDDQLDSIRDLVEKYGITAYVQLKTKPTASPPLTPRFNSIKEMLIEQNEQLRRQKDITCVASTRKGPNSKESDMVRLLRSKLQKLGCVVEAGDHTRFWVSAPRRLLKDVHELSTAYPIEMIITTMD